MLPPPPLPVDEAPSELSTPAPTPGVLDPFFTTVFWVSWVGVAAGFGAVWFSARTLGFTTWWLGPEGDQRHIVVSLLPFVTPIFLAVGALRRQPYMPWLGLGGAAVTAVVGAFDIGRPAAYWMAELLIAVGGALVSVASLAGMHRR
jgi:hypothetical protein